jgi:hypothetical protein
VTTTANGLSLSIQNCFPGSAEFLLTSTAAGELQASGITVDNGTVTGVDFDGNITGAKSLVAQGGPNLDLDVLARPFVTGPLYRIDAHTFAGAGGCRVWGTITPSN